MLITYTAYGKREELILFLKLMSYQIHMCGEKSFRKYVLDDDNEYEDELEQDVYSVTFITEGASTTKEVAEMAGNNITLIYSLRVPNRNIEKSALKAKNSASYTHLTVNNMPYKDYKSFSVGEEEFYVENHVLKPLGCFEDLESYESRRN